MKWYEKMALIAAGVLFLAAVIVFPFHIDAAADIDVAMSSVRKAMLYQAVGKPFIDTSLLDIYNAIESERRRHPVEWKFVCDDDIADYNKIHKMVEAMTDKSAK